METRNEELRRLKRTVYSLQTSAFGAANLIGRGTLSLPKDLRAKIIQAHYLANDIAREVSELDEGMVRPNPGLEAGTQVRIRAHTSEPNQGLSYPSFQGTLKEYCNCEGWDVVEVEDANDEEVSVYSFDVSAL